jgi:hypothetical protein
MVEQQLFIITIVRTLVEVAGWALIGQGVLALLAGNTRQNNFVYQIFQIVTRPIIRAVRAISPKVIVDAHIPFIAFFLLFWIWLGLAYYKHQVCITHQLAC